MLNKESAGEISPMSFEVKHLLLSLVDFTIGGFQGFPYDRTTLGGRPSDQMKVSEALKLEGDLYIGVQYGIAGTILKAWRDSSFLVQQIKVTEDANRGWQYLPLNDFKTVAQWAMEPDTHPLDGINWKGKPFGTQNLYRVAKSAGKGIYIGIKG